MRKIGELYDGEIEERAKIRAHTPPPTNTRNPEVYYARFGDNHQHLFKRGKYDPWNSWYEFGMEKDVREKFWYPNIRNGDVVVDVGASWGSYAITAAILGAQVHAFEPDSNIFPELKDNIKLNNLDICAYNYGLSDKTDIINWQEINAMTVYPLDGFKIPADFIKIDVEGQELNVIEGARQTITTHKPKLLIEAHFEYDNLMAVKLAETIMKMVDGYKLITWDYQVTVTACMYFWNEK